MPQQAPQRNCNSQSQVSSMWVGALWRWRGWSRPVWRSNASEFDSPPRSGGQKGSFPGAQARGRQAPHWALFPKPHLRGPPGAWAVALSLAPSPSLLPPLLYCWLEGQGRVKTSVAGFCLSLGGRGVQTGPDVVGLWAAEAASLGAGCGGGARVGGREQDWGRVGAHFLEAGSSVLRGVHKPLKSTGLRPKALDPFMRG